MSKQATKKCRECQEDIPANAKKCSKCGAKQGNWMARHPVWTAIIAFILVVMTFGSSNKSKESFEKGFEQGYTESTQANEKVKNKDEIIENVTTSNPQQINAEEKNSIEESSEEITQVSETTEVTDENNKVAAPTTGEKNALKKAQSYLSFSAFSYTGLIKQLEFEGFSHEEAVYGADNINADWNQQAAKKAESYMEFSSFSHDALIKQLEFEGFTNEQAEFGAKSVGY